MSNTTKNDLIRVENPLASLISKEELLEACPNLYEFLSGILSRSEGVYDIIFSDGGSKDTNNILVAIKGHNGVFMSGFTVAKGTFKLIPADNSHLLPLDILGNGLYVGLASIVLNLSKGYSKGLIVNVSRQGFKFNMVRIRNGVPVSEKGEPKPELKPKAQEPKEVKPNKPKSYEHLDVRLRFAKALREEVEGNLGDKITNLYDSKSVKDAVKLVASSYTEDKEFVIQTRSIRQLTDNGFESGEVYGIFLKGATSRTPLGYISEDSAMAYVDGQIISGELPQELEDGFRGMVGIARYTDGSDKILLNVKITDKAILIDITK
jgi:hypothetical protein